MARVNDAVALGVRVKTGRASAVVLAASPDGCELVGRRELLLCDRALPESRFPFHAVLEKDGDEAKELLERLTALVRTAAQASVQELVGELSARGTAPRGAGIVVSSLTDPAAVRSGHMHAHAAEGQLFRDAVAEALRQVDLPFFTCVEKDVQARATAALGVRREVLSARLSALRKQAGAPWRAEEKAAALAAWIALRGERR